MTACFATSLLGRREGTLPVRADATPGVLPAAGLFRPGDFLPWAAFHLLCFWTWSGPESVARLLGADGFDAGFGLGGGAR